MSGTRLSIARDLLHDLSRLVQGAADDGDEKTLGYVEQAAGSIADYARSPQWIKGRRKSG